MKAYFIVVTYDTGEKEFCQMGISDEGYDTNFTTSREVAERILSRMMRMFEGDGHEFVLHEVTV